MLAAFDGGQNPESEHWGMPTGEASMVCWPDRWWNLGCCFWTEGQIVWGKWCRDTDTAVCPLRPAQRPPCTLQGSQGCFELLPTVTLPSDYLLLLPHSSSAFKTGPCIETDSSGREYTNWRKNTIASAVNSKLYFMLKATDFIRRLRKKVSSGLRFYQSFFKHIKTQKLFHLAI